MNFLPLSNYLQIIERAWNNHDGEKISTFISMRHEHTQYPNYQLENAQALVQRFLASPIDEFIILHLRCCYYFNREMFMDAFETQRALTQSFTKVLQMQKEENWSLPIMYTICSDLRLLAQLAEKTRTGPNDKPGEILENAAEALMGCFRVCAADNRSSEQDTKRIGMMALVNQLFKVYFRINKLHLCRPLMRAISSSPFLRKFSLSQQVTYRYFVGRKAMFDSDYATADMHLTYAFENCHRQSVRNKRLILLYLVPVKILLGYIPSRYVLEKYDLVQFWNLVQAVCQGNLKEFDEMLEAHEAFFIQCGIYLIIAKLKIVAYRNLFKKVYTILQTHQIPVEALRTALVFLGQKDVDLDETECIVANLIYEGKIKGYISHQHRKVVVSKQNPFPPLKSLH